MNTHFFQRYHSKEIVATANAMLLLPRLYHYSPDIFFLFLKGFIFSDEFEPDISFQLQERGVDSVPNNLHDVEHRYLFVEQFYPTDFKKISPRAPMGSRIFDLSGLLEREALTETRKIAEKLSKKHGSRS